MSVDMQCTEDEARETTTKMDCTMTLILSMQYMTEAGNQMIKPFSRGERRTGTKEQHAGWEMLRRR
jgi:hypothetical protein